MEKTSEKDKKRRRKIKNEGEPEKMTLDEKRRLWTRKDDFGQEKTNEDEKR